MKLNRTWEMKVNQSENTPKLMYQSTKKQGLLANQIFRERMLKDLRITTKRQKQIIYSRKVRNKGKQGSLKLVLKNK